MPSSATTRNRIEKQATGENLNTWGSRLNQSGLDLIDESLDGVEAIAISGATTTLTSSNYVSDQARNRVLVLSGTLTADSDIVVPGVEKWYVVVDNTVRAGFTLTMKCSGQPGYALRPGPQIVYCDATDVRRATPALNQLPLPTGAVDFNGQAISGVAALAMSGALSVGGAITGPSSVTLAGYSAPTTNATLAPKKYVDDTAFGMASGAFPAQGGNAGKVLGTDGSTAGWHGADDAVWCTAGGTADAITLTPANGTSSLSAGQRIAFIAAASNTGAVTVAYNGASAVALESADSTALAAGQIASGVLVVAVYDGTEFRLVGPVGASESLAGVAELATQDEVNAETDDARIVTALKLATYLLQRNHTFAKAQRGAFTTLADGATITPDFAAGNFFAVTLGGNRTLANPTNLVAGQSGSIILRQDATGSRTLAYGSYWKWPGGIAPTLTTAANRVDRIDYLVVSSTEIHANFTADVR